MVSASKTFVHAKTVPALLIPLVLLIQPQFALRATLVTLLPLILVKKTSARVPTDPELPIPRVLLTATLSVPHATPDTLSTVNLASKI